VTKAGIARSFIKNRGTKGAKVPMIEEKNEKAMVNGTSGSARRFETSPVMGKLPKYSPRIGKTAIWAAKLTARIVRSSKVFGTNFRTCKRIGTPKIIPNVAEADRKNPISDWMIWGSKSPIIAIETKIRLRASVKRPDVTANPRIPPMIAARKIGASNPVMETKKIRAKIEAAKFIFRPKRRNNIDTKNTRIVTLKPLTTSKCCRPEFLKSFWTNSGSWFLTPSKTPMAMIECGLGRLLFKLSARKLRAVSAVRITGFPSHLGQRISSSSGFLMIVFTPNRLRKLW